MILAISSWLATTLEVAAGLSLVAGLVGLLWKWTPVVWIRKRFTAGIEVEREERIQRVATKAVTEVVAPLVVLQTSHASEVSDSLSELLTASREQDRRISELEIDKIRRDAERLGFQRGKEAATPVQA